MQKLYCDRAEGERGGKSYIAIEPEAGVEAKVILRSRRRRVERQIKSYIAIEPKAAWRVTSVTSA